MKRQEAIATKAVYYSGKSCRYGHGNIRYTTTGQCIHCVKIQVKENRQNNRERFNANSKRYNKEKVFGTEKYKAQRREHYRKFRIKILERAKQPHIRAKRTALQNKRYIMAKNAMPNWANQDLIEYKYLEAKFMEWFTGEKYHVDHIVPLQGKNVCGLHVENNLQVIPAIENISKSNKYQGE